MYWPAGHVALCVAHWRSDVAVAAAVSYSPLPHTSAVLHAAPSLALEKLVPTVHAAHVRSVVAVPSVASPLPAAHVRHTVHTRSLVWVPAAVS